MAVVVEVADDRHVDAEPADLADHLRDGRGGLVGVDRHAHELRAGMRQARDLDRGGVRVGGVGVGHRLDDDRVGAADEHAADIDADRRVPPRPELVWRAHVPAAQAPGDVEAGDPDDEREQEDEPDHVGQLLGAQADPRPEEALEHDHQHPATVERRERQDVHEREVGRQDARDVEGHDRTGVPEHVADLRGDADRSGDRWRRGRVRGERRHERAKPAEDQAEPARPSRRRRPRWPSAGIVRGGFAEERGLPWLVRSG